MAEVTVVDASGGGLAPDTVRILVNRTLASEQAGLDRVAVSFIAASVMRDLNRRHRQQEGPTDVLSFPFDRRFPQGSGGEILVCPEAIRSGREPAQEMAHLIVHGTLHLLGYEDETAAGLARMERKTEAILEAVHG